MNLGGGGTQFSPPQIVTIRVAPSITLRVWDLISVIVMKTISGSIMKNTLRTPFNIHAFFPNATFCPRIHPSGLRKRKRPQCILSPFPHHLCEMLITASTIGEILSFCKNHTAEGRLSGYNYTNRNWSQAGRDGYHPSYIRCRGSSSNYHRLEV